MAMVTHYPEIITFRHKYFRNLDWGAVERREVTPEFVPKLKDPKVSYLIYFEPEIELIFFRTQSTLTRSSQARTPAPSVMTAAMATAMTLSNFMMRPLRDLVFVTLTFSIDVSYILHTFLYKALLKLM